MVKQRFSLASPKKRTALIVGLFVIFMLLVLLAAYRFAVSPRVMLAGNIISSVSTDNKVVALTFDDGPLPNSTEDTLDILSKNNIRATFFVIGKEAETNREQLEKIIAAGHAVGNHSYSHRALVFMLPRDIRVEITQTDEIIRSAGYTGDIPFRPPYNAKAIFLPLYLLKEGRSSISRDILPDEGENETADEIANSVIRQVQPGSIVTLHPMYSHTVSTRQALEAIITRLQADGYEFLTIPELLELVET